MMRFFATFVALVAAARLATAEIPDTYAPAGTNSPPARAPSAATSSSTDNGAAKTPVTKPAKSAHATAPTVQALLQMQASLDQLTKSNHDLLDLLKQQQSVLEDIQYDRRLQSRQIDNLEQRLEETLTEKQQLEEKVDNLEAQAAVRPAIPTIPAPTPAPVPNPSPASVPPPAPTPQPITAPIITSVQTPDATTPPAGAPPPPPATYLPPEGADKPPGPESWHRIVKLKGTDNLQTDIFTVHGKVWRVLWHNQDKPGKLFANTSALFINAFPRDDTIPEKVASKLGSGGDATELQGAGNYYLKIEASGGSWELAVEDFY